MNRFLRHTVLLAGLLAGGTVAAAPPLAVLKRQDGIPERYAGSLLPGKVMIPAVYREPAAEMRGIWIATVENLDFPPQHTAAGVQNTFRSLFRQLAAKRFNAVFFQVRPCNDAFYVSRLNPWSTYLSGREGVPVPGCDPLATAIREAHQCGMELHAWLNPYRVTNRTKKSKLAYLATLSPNNFARRNPHLVLAAPLPGGGRLLFLNPGEPAVIRHVAQTVREIVERYPVDGIVFDDYFYPYTDIGSIDAACFVRNNPGRLSRNEWRVHNVTSLILAVRKELEDHRLRTGKKVPFGISPFGIWANAKDRPEGSLTAGKSSLLSQYADSREWARRHYIDYIAPQLYWPFGHDTAAYAALVDWWARQVRGTGTDLYIGMAPYRIGEAKWRQPQELLNQLRYNTKYPEVKGQILYRSSSVLSPSNPMMSNALRLMSTRYWTRNVPVRNSGAKFPKFR